MWNVPDLLIWILSLACLLCVLLRPWGVDVVSGVEAAPGRKDSRKVAEFVARARETAGK